MRRDPEEHEAVVAGMKAPHASSACLDSARLTALDAAISRGAVVDASPPAVIDAPAPPARSPGRQHCLYFLLLPHGHLSFRAARRATAGTARGRVGGTLKVGRSREACGPRPSLEPARVT